MNINLHITTLFTGSLRKKRLKRIIIYRQKKCIGKNFAYKSRTNYIRNQREIKRCLFFFFISNFCSAP